MSATETANRLADLATDEMFDQLWDAVIKPMLDTQILNRRVVEVIGEKFRRSQFTQRLRDKYAEQYIRYFTPEELVALLEWSESDLSRKLRQYAVEMTVENFRLGQELGEQIADQIESEGLEKLLTDDEFNEMNRDAVPERLRDCELGAQFLDEICPIKVALQYRYTALDQSGKEFTGTVEALNSDDALTAIREANPQCLVTRIKQLA